MGAKSKKNKAEWSIAENAKKDKDSGAGVGRGNKMERTREAFKAWLLLPRTFLGASEQVLRALGIIEPDAVELCGIRSQSEFASKFGIAEPTLSRWKRDLERDGSDLKDFGFQMQRLTKNVLGALYRKAMADADAPRVKLWLQVVEGWSESSPGLPSPHTELSDEEKATLDRLIEKNT